MLYQFIKKKQVQINTMLVWSKTEAAFFFI